MVLPKRSVAVYDKASANFSINFIVSSHFNVGESQIQIQLEPVQITLMLIFNNGLEWECHT